MIPIGQIVDDHYAPAGGLNTLLPSGIKRIVVHNQPIGLQIAQDFASLAGV